MADEASRLDDSTDTPRSRAVRGGSLIQRGESGSLMPAPAGTAQQTALHAAGIADSSGGLRGIEGPRRGHLPESNLTDRESIVRDPAGPTVNSIFFSLSPARTASANSRGVRTPTPLT